MTDYMRVSSAPERRQTLSRTESSRSFSSEPSRSEESEDFLGTDSDDSHSASTENEHSTQDEGSSMGGMGLTEWQGPSSTMATTVLSQQEVLRQLHLRRHIDLLKKNMEEKEQAVEEAREQLIRCREHLSQLLSQCASLEETISHCSSKEQQEVERDGDEGRMSVASVGLLRSKLGKVRKEIAAEEEMEKSIQGKLKTAELGLSEAQVSYGRFEEAEVKLEWEEAVAREVRGRKAMQRLQGQTRMMVNAEMNRKAQERLHHISLMEQEEQMRVALERARLTQEEGRKFLRQTLDRRRRQEEVEGERHRTHLERRMKALLSLKNNIEDSQGTIQAQQMLVRENEKKQRKFEKAERDQILSEGGNPDEVFLKRQRIETFKKTKDAFTKKQRERQLQIVSRLLEESWMQKRLKTKFSKSHWHNREQAPHPSKRNLHLQKKRKVTTQHDESEAVVTEGEAPVIESKDDEEESVGKPAEGEKKKGVHFDSSDEESHFDELLRESQTTAKIASEENLAEPEIQGLWEKKRKTVALSGGGERGQEGGRGGGKVESKAEREMRESAMEKLRKSIVVKQVAAGREFKGQAFLSKPAEVVFKDFEVGKVFRRRLQLTNVSYTVNHCKLLGLSEHLKDFITVNFNPPGAMSAGLTCNMNVTFEPKLNKDLVGEIHFVSQTGPFSIPVKCLKKQCLISVEKREVDFGRVCVGETVHRRITLHNTGALPTRFQFVAAPSAVPAIQVSSVASCVPPLSDEDSVGELSDKSALSVMSAVDVTMTQQGLPGVDEDQLKSRSVGNLGSLSQKSLTWKDERGKQGRVEEGEGEEEERKREGGGGDATNHSKEDAPGNCDDDIFVTQSQAALSIPDRVHTSAIKVGKVSEGEIGAFSSCSVEVVFAPEDASSSSEEFRLTFSHPSLQPVSIQARGQGIDLPVYVEREMMDLRICMLERLYQDSIVVHNRAVTALRITFHLPAELHSHMEILPKHGLVQGESSFSAQLKFTPKPSIFVECSGYFNVDSGYLEVPVQIEVVEQTRPVLLTVYAQVTSSDLEFSVPTLDFGSCTVHESAVATLHITNKSILPQQFGFVNLPEFVEVQPGDGFGTLLPHETLPLDVIFSARKPREYSFELTCKTGTDGTFKLPCCGVGVLPPLELSENIINFAPTAVNDVRTAKVSLHNLKLGRLNSAVIRGAILLQGPKAFEFVVPRGVPISICPQVGVVPLGESVDVQVQFTPRLDSVAIHQEALKLATALALQTQEPETLSSDQPQETDQQPSPLKKPKRQPSRQSQKSSLPSSSKASLVSSSSQIKPPPSAGRGSKQRQLQQVEPPREGSDLWWQAYSNLLNDSENKCLQLSIPCFVSSEAPRSELDTVAYRPEDTLYLEVTAPIVRPGLAVISDSGRTTIDFTNVGTGDTALRTVTVKNISGSFLNLTSSLLDPHGPFELRNALRDLPPGASHNVLIKFSPQTGGKYYERLKLYYGSHSSSLELKLAGKGVDPHVELLPEGDVCDMRHALVSDTTTKTLQLKNHSSLSVRYHARLESLLPSIRTEYPFRTSNYNGQPAFNCVPFKGKIESGETQEIAVNFSPDHESPFYADVLLIELNGQPSYTVHLKGQGCSTSMFVLGGEAIGPREESMTARIPPPDEHPPPPKPLLLMLVCRSGEGRSLPVTREIQVGCIKTPLVKKNSGDFVIDPIPASNHNAKSFSIEPLKSSVEAGGLKTVTITFHPPKDSSVQTLEASTNLTLKGDTVQVYRLLLRGLVCE